MNHRMEELEDGLRLALAGDLTIGNASQMREALLELMNRARDARLDLSGAFAIDVTGLQLLCSAHRTAVSKGLNLSLENGVPKELAEAMETAGFLRDKGCSFDVPGTCLWKGVIIP